jgi:hypothetical protein
MTNEWEEVPIIYSAPYPRVKINKRYKRLHIVMLEAFVGPRPKGLLGLHKNDVKTDNSLENLYYGTPTRNVLDRAQNGKGAENSLINRGILDENDIDAIRRLRIEGWSNKDLADVYCVHPNTISLIVREKYWLDLQNQKATSVQAGSYGQPGPVLVE